MAAPVITTLPALPGVGVPFDSDDADDFGAAWDALPAEANAQAAYRDIQDPITELTGLEGASAGDDTLWITGTIYAYGDVVWSPTDFQDYKRMIAGAGSTDPASDPTNWQPVTGSGDATATGSETWTNKTFANPILTGCEIEEVYSFTGAASVDIDPADGSIQIWTLDADSVPTAASFADGHEITMQVYTGGWTVDWTTIGVVWLNGFEPLEEIEKYSLIVLFNDGGTIYGKYVGLLQSPIYLDLNFLSSQTLDSRITFTRASSGTRVNSSGLIESITTNNPRFDYDPVTLAAKGLLIEEQRTNLLTYPSQLNNAAWNKQTNVTVTADTLSSPDGDTNADTVTWTSASNNTGTFQSAITVSGASPNTKSIYYKAASASGTFGLADPSNMVGETLSNFDTSWQRASLSETQPGAAGLWLRHKSGSPNAPYFWGAQLEQGAFATSYIPTVASQVTRSADVAAMTGSAFSSVWNATEGTFLWEGDSPASGTRPLLSLDDDTANEQINLYTSGTNLKLTIIDGGSTVADITIGTIVANTPFKVAFRIKADDVAVSLDGATAVADTDTVGGLPTVNRIRFGSDKAGNYQCGHQRRVSYYRTGLVDDTLESLAGA